MGGAQVTSISDVYLSAIRALQCYACTDWGVCFYPLVVTGWSYSNRALCNGFVSVVACLCPAFTVTVLVRVVYKS